jgi:type IV secretion system protein VirB6
MGFFATFWSWLNNALSAYIGVYTIRVANALEPAVVTIGTIYVMLWGYMHLTGKVEEPFIVGLKRIIVLAAVFGVGLHLWLYNEVIVDTFYQAPAELAASVIGAPDPVSVVDSIWSQGSSVAENLNSRASLMSGWGYAIAAYSIWILMGALCIYTMFLIALSKVALAVLIALGPLFIVMLLFDATSRYFMAWITQLANYAMISILTVMVSALFLQEVQKYAAQSAARGAAIFTTDALDMVLISVLALLFMFQVTQIAATLAGGGTPLNTFRLEHAAGQYVGGKAYGLGAGAVALTGAGLRGAGRFGVGLLSSSSKPRDEWSRSRKAGYAAKTKVARMMSSRNRIERVN